MSLKQKKCEEKYINKTLFIHTSQSQLISSNIRTKLVQARTYTSFYDISFSFLESLFISVGCFLTYNLFDYIGKSLPGFLQKVRSHSSLGQLNAILRFLFYQINEKVFADERRWKISKILFRLTSVCELFLSRNLNIFHNS